MKMPTAFEWDDAKAASNEAKHGISFRTAVEVFLDPRAVVVDATHPDDQERRAKVIGRIGAKLYSVVFTMRGVVARIISARRTNKPEDRIYGPF